MSPSATRSTIVTWSPSVLVRLSGVCSFGFAAALFLGASAAWSGGAKGPALFIGGLGVAFLAAGPLSIGGRKQVVVDPDAGTLTVSATIFGLPYSKGSVAIPDVTAIRVRPYDAGPQAGTFFRVDVVLDGAILAVISYGTHRQARELALELSRHTNGRVDDEHLGTSS